MATYFAESENLLLKLSATSMALKLAVTKLLTYHVSMLEEIKKDNEYFQLYYHAYSDSEDDLRLSEVFSSVSIEVDNLLVEMEKTDEK